MRKLLTISLLCQWLSVSNAPAQSVSDSLGPPSKYALVAEVASLIKQYAYFNGGTMVHRYDAWADTTQGLRLYVGNQVTLLGDRSKPDWYYVDFSQPVKPTQLVATMGRNDNFYVTSAKAITRREKNDRNAARLFRGREFIEPRQVHAQNLAVKKKQRRQRLILRRSRHIALDRQMRQKRLDFRRAHICGISDVVKPDKPPDPSQISLLGLITIMPHAHHSPHSVKKFSHHILLFAVKIYDKLQIHVEM